MPPRSTPKTLGRFQIVRPLGAGAQGTVYLARDPRLGREVAIKTLRLHGSPDVHAAQLKTLLDEARIVSQLTHPNIVPLFDAGDEGGLPYLVFEYVEGILLSDAIRDKGPLEPARAADITIQILKAIGHAHRKGVLHRDIKPANIILTADSIPRVMDFGIAQLILSDVTDDDSFCGTPLYMAPEYVATKVFTERSDLFSIGMMLYEMLAGRPAVDGGNVYEVLHKIANEPFRPPSHIVPAIDERLDDLVMKALAKDPAGRFEAAVKMEGALYEYLNPEPVLAESASGQSSGTLDFLLRRMRHKSDFPALSSTISAVNQAASSEVEGVQALSNSILKDFALTNKLLKLVNTAFYGQFGGTISTVSRAVVILGFDKVRSAAVTLLLFEHLQNKGMAVQLKDDLISSYFTGLVSRELVHSAGIRVAEEAFICSMFHDLGGLLTRFYFPEESNEIDKLVQQKGLDAQQASLQVLGISFEELGIGVAKTWNFPEKLVKSMRRIGDDKVAQPKDEVGRLQAIAELSTDVASAIREPDPQTRNKKLTRIVSKFGQGMKVDREQLMMAVHNSVKEIELDAGILNFKASESSFLSQASGLAKESHAVAPKAIDSAVEDTLLDSRDATDLVAPDNGGASSANRQTILSAGIQDITNTLVGEYRLNDVLRMILETMFRGIGFTRVLLCVRDPKDSLLRARFGFGQDVDNILSKGFAVPVNGANDIFQMAVSKGVDIFIEDVNNDKVCQYVPDWYRKLVASSAFSLFPVVVNGKTIGMFYGDNSEAGCLQFKPEELSLLKTLRNQAVLAIRQRAG